MVSLAAWAAGTRTGNDDDLRPDQIRLAIQPPHPSGDAGPPLFLSSNSVPRSLPSPPCSRSGIPGRRPGRLPSATTARTTRLD